MIDKYRELLRSSLELTTEQVIFCHDKINELEARLRIEANNVNQ